MKKQIWIISYQDREINDIINSKPKSNKEILDERERLSLIFLVKDWKDKEKDLRKMIKESENSIKQK